MTNPRRVADEPYTLFVNQTEYGNARFLCTNLPLRPARTQEVHVGAGAP